MILEILKEFHPKLSIVHCKLNKMVKEDNYNFNKINNKEHFPLVSILLAVYKPNENWFIEQLVSLNSQTYINLELIIYDDCPEFPVDEELFKKYITNFPYKLIRGEENVGSNKAFEYLTKLGDGEFFAYCDQDDIWEENKIPLMVEKFNDKDVTLVCCDLSIIDENSIKTHNSLRDIRKRIVYKTGYDLAKSLLINNFVTGCAMIVRKKIAVKAIPFEKELFHDNWIAVIAALNGRIEFVDKQLIRYRQHTNNQTGILKGISDKNSYYKIKIVELLNRYKDLKKRLDEEEKLIEYIDYCINSLNIRENYFNNHKLKQLIMMIKYSDYYKMSILLEVFIPIIPEFVFKWIIKLAKKGIL